MRQRRRAHRFSGAIVLAALPSNGDRNVEMFAGQASSQRGTMSPTQRQTTFGPVVGTDLSGASGTYVWKGVPYAKPPVGELRWKAPADPDVRTSPRLTQQFGPASAQASRLYGPGLNNKYDATIGT